MPQDGGVADWHAQASQQPFGRTPTRGMAEQPHDSGHTRGAACERSREIRSTPGESATLTLIIYATPPGHPGLDQDRRPLCWQVLKRPNIRAVPGTGPRTTNRTVCVTLAVQRDGPAGTFAIYKRDLLLRHLLRHDRPQR